MFLELEEKIKRKEKLTDQDKLNLIFLPLMKSKVNKNEMAINSVELADGVTDDEDRML